MKGDAEMFENDFTITGKHASYLKFLAKKNAQEDSSEGAKNAAMIFERYIDVYMNAAIWGLLYNQTADIDNKSKDRARIYADAYARERDNCVFLYRLVMLLEEKTDASQQERIDRAFRYDVQPDKSEELKKCIDLFNSYVRGGIEIMYEKLTDGCSTRDDYITRIYELMSQFKLELDGTSYEKEIENLLN